MKIKQFMFSRTLLVGLFLFMGALSGCGSVKVGSDFDLQSFDAKVQHKVTTKAQVTAWLGSPHSKGIVVEADGNRLEKWTYYYGAGQLPDMNKATLKYLEIHFDPAGKVTAYNWSR